jgi:hypothetical protein
MQDFTILLKKTHAPIQDDKNSTGRSIRYHDVTMYKITGTGKFYKGMVGTGMLEPQRDLGISVKK